MTEVIYGNPDHKCRDDDCRGPMPLPKMWGMNCPACGKRQPTLRELKSRSPEPRAKLDVIGAPV